MSLLTPPPPLSLTLDFSIFAIYGRNLALTYCIPSRLSYMCHGCMRWKVHSFIMLCIKINVSVIIISVFFSMIFQNSRVWTWNNEKLLVPYAKCCLSLNNHDGCFIVSVFEQDNHLLHGPVMCVFAVLCGGKFFASLVTCQCCISKWGLMHNQGLRWLMTVLH